MPTKLLAVSFLAAAISGSAAAETASLENVLACKAIEAPLERVACYDEAVGRLEAAEAAGEVAVVTRADVEKVQRESFGFSIPSLPALAGFGGGDKKAEIERITVPVESVSGGSSSRLRIKLANGQVWVQADDKRIKAKSPKSAEVFEAALGSYKMKLDDGLAFRVKREQ